MSLICVVLAAGAAAYVWGMQESYTATDYRGLGLQPMAGGVGGGADEAAAADEGAHAKSGGGSGRSSPENPLLHSRRLEVVPEGAEEAEDLEA